VNCVADSSLEGRGWVGAGGGAATTLELAVVGGSTAIANDKRRAESATETIEGNILGTYRVMAFEPSPLRFEANVKKESRGCANNVRGACRMTRKRCLGHVPMNRIVVVKHGMGRTVRLPVAEFNGE
jgi:hypothetical protein